MVSLAVSAPSGTPRIVDVGLEDAVWQGSSSVTGRMPAGGSSTLVVSLDAAEVLEVVWSSSELPGSPPAGPAAQVGFQVGPVDASTSSVSASGTQVFAGSGSVEVTVVPRDACGLDLGPGHTVELAPSHGSLTNVQDHGDGTYTASFSSDAGLCPADPALIVATVNEVVLNEQPQVSVLCAELDPGSPVSVLPESENTRACASKGEFARVRVIPRDAQGAPLPPGQAVTLVENPPYIVGGGVEMTIDQDTGAPIYTVLVGSNRCSLGGPYSIEVRVANIPLTTRPTLDFACPPIPEGGVSFVATPAVVPADGTTASQVRVSVVDACGNPGFGRSLTLSSHGETHVVLSVENATTSDEPGSPLDGTALLEVRSNEAGTTGVAARIDDTLHQSNGDLITFVSPEDPEMYLGGNGVFLGCATASAAKSGSGGAVAGLLWLGLLLVLRSRKVTR
jgi:MYXO-CTERM domain-containing protein